MLITFSYFLQSKCVLTLQCVCLCDFYEKGWCSGEDVYLFHWLLSPRVLFVLGQVKLIWFIVFRCSSAIYIEARCILFRIFIIMRIFWVKMKYEMTIYSIKRVVFLRTFIPCVTHNSKFLIKKHVPETQQKIYIWFENCEFSKHGYFANI